jgi:hypothetical protein
LKARIAKGERNPDAIKATTALRRFVDPRDAAEAALFLCSDRAAAITGVTLPVDAGWLVQPLTRNTCKAIPSARRRNRTERGHGRRQTPRLRRVHPHGEGGRARLLRAETSLDDIGDFGEINLVWDAWAPIKHTPGRSSAISPSHR